MRLGWARIGAIVILCALLSGGFLFAQSASGQQTASTETKFRRDTSSDAFDGPAIPAATPAGMAQPIEIAKIDLVQNSVGLDPDMHFMDAASSDAYGDEPSVLDRTPADNRVMSAEANAGFGLYNQKCGRCHALHSPTDFSAAEWPGIVREMKQEAGLSESEVSMITAYLTSAAGESAGEAKGASGPRIGGYLYTEFFRTESTQKNWDIHYLTLTVSGWANEKIRYFAEFELEHGGQADNTFVEQAYIDYWFNDLLAVKVGAILTPFNRFDDFHMPLSNYAITRPQVSREIGASAWKDVGINFHGYYNFCNLTVKYDAYWINGLGDGSNIRGSRQYRDNNEEMAVGGRLSLVFFDELEVGGSIYSGDWDDDMTLNLTMVGTHFLWTNDWVDIYGEYANARSENPVGTDDGSMYGYFIQASKGICNDRFRFTTRYGKLDYLDPGTALGRDAGSGNKDVRELLFAVAYYPTPNVVFKLEYTIYNEGVRVANVENDQFGFQAAVRW